MAPAKRALVLSGGGAYAAYEVGVMRALFTGASPATAFEPIEAEVISGTSAGSVNAAIIASVAGDDAVAAVDYLERAWITSLADQPGTCGGNVLRLRANPFSLLNPACLAGESHFYPTFAADLAYLTDETVARGERFLRSSAAFSQRLIESFDLGTLITGAPLREVLEDIVNLDQIRRSPRAMRIAATNWRTGELRVFRNLDLTDAEGINVLLASSAIPGVFPSVEIGNEPYVDGGVVMNTPLRPAIRAGATELHVIYMDPDVRRIPLPRVRNTLNTLYRMLVISFGLTVSRDIRTAAGINLRLRDTPTAAHTTALTGQPRAKSYKPLAIHRYHPSEDLGGAFRWLDFERDHIITLIDQGYEDARVHDCEANRCVLPGSEDAFVMAETAEWARRDA